ncbi:MAG: transposase, partial [Pirellulales bacterium]
QIQGGIVYHVLNRGAGRMTLFDKPQDYEAFERVVEEAVERTTIRILGYCLMPNHWHFLVWPRGDDELSQVMRWPIVTHTKRWPRLHPINDSRPPFLSRRLCKAVIGSELHCLG